MVVVLVMLLLLNSALLINEELGRRNCSMTFSPVAWYFTL
jgi:hypothetical protein